MRSHFQKITFYYPNIKILILNLFQDVGNRGMINIDRNTFESLFNQYYSGLIMYANRFTNQTEVSEDIVHDVFISLWGKRNSLLMESAAYPLLIRPQPLPESLGTIKGTQRVPRATLQKGTLPDYSLGNITWNQNFGNILKRQSVNFPLNAKRFSL